MNENCVWTCIKQYNTDGLPFIGFMLFKNHTWMFLFGIYGFSWVNMIQYLFISWERLSKRAMCFVLKQVACKAAEEHACIQNHLALLTSLSPLRASTRYSNIFRQCTVLLKSSLIASRYIHEEHKTSQLSQLTRFS